MKLKLLAAGLTLALSSIQSASALNIVLTNDDSWNTENIQVLNAALKKQATMSLCPHLALNKAVKVVQSVF
ncbi:hypothetical protein N7931_16765 [Catenovulum sp. 2E275]|uniref:hypothetical protein n=1 Tax=Catenovulum sp. 2E275 TaxID=2980497 RepID=UPI0021CF7FC5|nr:hypothetical protein [Catenovulum sp. 2E275]MCU4677278.1 hypothetical protein [Catenovulum sp. 2E275]